MTIEAKINATNVLIEQEAFKDNGEMLKYQEKKIKQAMSIEKDASDEIEILLPKLESTVELLDDGDFSLTADFIIENLVKDQGQRGEIARKIIKYNSKQQAIQDLIQSLYLNE